MSDHPQVVIVAGPVRRSSIRNYGRTSKNGSNVNGHPRVDFVKHSSMALEAAREAVQAAKLYHKRMGNSIVAMRDGKIIEIPPEEIDVEDPLDKNSQS